MSQKWKRLDKKEPKWIRKFLWILSFLSLFENLNFGNFKILKFLTIFSNLYQCEDERRSRQNWISRPKVNLTKSQGLHFISATKFRAEEKNSSKKVITNFLLWHLWFDEQKILRFQFYSYWKLCASDEIRSESN